MKKLLTITAAIFLLAFPVLAQATTYNVKFCFGYEMNFTDQSTGDYLLTGDPKAVGIWAKVHQTSPYMTRFENWTDSEGCTPALSVYSTTTYVISMTSEYKINNQLVYLVVRVLGPKSLILLDNSPNLC